MAVECLVANVISSSEARRTLPRACYHYCYYYYYYNHYTSSIADNWLFSPALPSRQLPAGTRQIWSNEVSVPEMSLWQSGLSTAGRASNSSSDCRILQPGFAAVDGTTGQVLLAPAAAGQILSGAHRCPQNYTCAGGDPTTAAAVPRRCPRGLWTRVEDDDVRDDPYSIAGATNVAQCLAPPGWFVPGNSIDDIQECPSGTYKEGWDLAAVCTSCGEGPWLSDRVTAVPLLSLANSSDVGQEDVAWEKRYGLEPAAPCRPCPANQITHGNDSRAASYVDKLGQEVLIPEGGYYSPAACVNRPGYGYSSFGIQPCDKGEYSPGYNVNPCQQCPFATTTLEGSSTSIDNCSVHAAGFGSDPKTGSPATCAKGTYSDGTDLHMYVEITPSVWRAPTPGESEYEDGDDFAPWPTSPLYAKSSSQCLAAFSQTVEGNSWLHLIPGQEYVKRNRLGSLDVCARACDEDKGCAAATFNYGDFSCWLWRPSSGGSSFAQTGGIAFKTFLSGVMTISVADADQAPAGETLAASGSNSTNKQTTQVAMPVTAGTLERDSVIAKSTGTAHPPQAEKAAGDDEDGHIAWMPWEDEQTAGAQKGNKDAKAVFWSPHSDDEEPQQQEPRLENKAGLGAGIPAKVAALKAKEAAEDLQQKMKELAEEEEVDPLEAFIDEEEEPDLEIQIPTSRVKLLVGPGGSTIKDIQKKSK
eukprot:gene4059-4306_t